MNASDLIASALAAQPASTCDLFLQMREDKAPRRVLSGIPIDDAPVALLRLGVAWSQTKKGRDFSPCPANGYERILRFSSGKVAGSLFVEVVPAGEVTA